ncbi:hypothetical protein GMORB2_3105 [Geosmithia morbida]|uniref:Uncharacterized protein n=1 Tax=Geosmithia morbida TaxID=1094350 RepID=A0A9P5D3A2_9HYPO|nr:uncharacterized protein GMORB2_3105 [Geosmithia morbida]KAF4120304.1 hypothetical protein GMORB2_3105 [Geosmithia morbida]
MSKYKDMAKAKWQEKPGGSLRGHVSSLAGRVKPDNSAANNHVARPISELRDPSSFAPPPKRTGSGLAPAPAPTETGKRKTVPSPSKYQDPRTGQSLALYGSTDGIREEEHEHESEQQGQAAPRPYRVNTTGLSTDHLPPPPGRRDGTGGDAAAGAGGLQAIEAAPPPAYETAAAGRPSLPPRLPPRTNTGTAASSMAESPSADSSSRYLNQEAISRLGSAGVSVPGLGIGSQKQTTATATATATATPPPPPPRRPSNQPQGQVNELQNRLARYGISSSNATPQVQQEQQQQPQPAQEQEQGQLSGGTTWAQKQAALRTASSFNKDPSSVSVSDARTAAGTVNNFRQRHGHQVAAGAKNLTFAMPD